MVVSARDAARIALRRVETEDTFASTVLDQEFERTSLDARDRALATELTYGVIRHRSRLDRALDAYAKKPVGKLSRALRLVARLGAYQLLFLDRVPAHAAVNDAVSAARQVGGSSMAGFMNGLLRRLQTNGEPALPSPALIREYAEIAYSTPGEIVDLVSRALGPEGDLSAAVGGLNTPAPLWLRVNTNRANVHDVIDALVAGGAELGRIDEDAVSFRGIGSPDGAPGFAEGLWTVQDLGAQWVSRAARVQPGMDVLDVCAGVGGKTAHLASRLEGHGTVDAIDIDGGKIDLLKSLWARLGISGVKHRTFVGDARTAVAETGSAYDVVVVDAPCSGLGVLRRHPERKWRFHAESLGPLTTMQAGLLDAAADAVLPGGALVYSVCSFVPQEGPQQIIEFLKRRSDFVLEPALFGIAGGFQVWPHLHDADGFFIARLGRNT